MAGDPPLAATALPLAATLTAASACGSGGGTQTTTTLGKDGKQWFLDDVSAAEQRSP